MNPTVDKTQEAKISVMGELAHQMFPDHEVKSYQGCFLRGLAQTMDKMEIHKWTPVTDLPARKRELFFQELIENSANCLSKIGLSRGQVVSLKHRLILENKRRLNR